MMIGPLRMAMKEESAMLPPLTARYRHPGDILLHLGNCLFLRKFAEFIQGIVEVGDAGSGDSACAIALVQDTQRFIIFVLLQPLMLAKANRTITDQVEREKGSATVLNKVNDRFEKRFSNSDFLQCVDRDVGFFEAWVSVFDDLLNWKSR